MCVKFFIFVSIFIENSATAFSGVEPKGYIKDLSFGVRVAGVYLSIEPPVSLYDCSMECIYRRRCKSFNYSYNMKYCELSTREIANAETYPKSEISHGFVHSNARKWMKHLWGKCANNSCPLNTKCMAETGSCNFSDCGAAKRIQNMEGPESGHFAAGTGAVYRCKRGQEMVDENGNLVESGESVARCTERAEWKTNNYTCRYPRVPVRLVEGIYHRRGHVEAFVEGQWRSIANTNWSNNEALVACRSLGYIEGKLWGNVTRKGVVVWMIDITCRGNEENINDCHRTDLAQSFKTYADIKAVFCNPVQLSERIAGVTYNNFAGRAMMYINSQWLPICSNAWDQNSADVACRSRWNWTSAFEFGVLKWSVSGIQVSCNGSLEATLFNCTYTKVANCDGGVGYVFCTDPSIRLVVEGTPHMGLVEIYRNNMWKKLLDEEWTHNDANVVCRSLGYRGMGQTVNITKQKSRAIFTTNVTCLGTEKYLDQCSQFSSEGTVRSQAYVTCYQCKKGWMYESGSCYYLSNLIMDWNSAQRFCKEYDSNLVKVDDEREHNTIKSYSPGIPSMIWLGASNIQKESEWKWVADDAIFSFSKWRPGQPDNAGGNEHCLELLEGLWNDAPCNVMKMFLCEQKVTITT